ncbi:MAG TPA: TolC family protein [Chthonomonadaceae bacterium]|nr:TolC family protein [Chthonomonadaceae bacterium]
MRILRLVLFCALATAGLPAVAQDAPRKLTLEEAMRTALKQSPALQQTTHQAAAAGARVRQAQAGFLPTLSVQSSATDGPLGAPPLGLQGLAGDPLKKHYGTSLNLIQSLYDFGRTQHLVAARQSLLQAAEEDIQTRKALVLLETQQAYLNVLRTQQLANLQQDNLKQREATVEQAKLFAGKGLKAEVDVQLALADASDARVTVIAAQNDIRFAFAELNSVMGETKLTEYLLDNPIKPEFYLKVPKIETLIKDALAQRPELRSLTLQRAAADQSVQAARSELLPHLDAVASFGALTPSSAIPHDRDYAVGVAVTIPLYTGGAVEGRITEEKQKREALIAQRNELEEAIKLQVTHAWLDVQTRAVQVQAAREQVTAATDSRQLASERYRLQLNTIVELTAAEAIFTRAQTQLINAQYDLDLAGLALEWSVGLTNFHYDSHTPYGP